MPQHAWCDWIAPTTRWTHCCQKLCINEEYFACVLQVVPVFVIKELAQQFNRWLGSIYLSCWHVHVVDEDDCLLIRWRSKVALLSTIHFCHYEKLHKHIFHYFITKSHLLQILDRYDMQRHICSVVQRQMLSVTN